MGGCKYLGPWGLAPPRGVEDLNFVSCFLAGRGPQVPCVLTRCGDSRQEVRDGL